MFNHITIQLTYTYREHMRHSNASKVFSRRRREEKHKITLTKYSLRKIENLHIPSLWTNSSLILGKLEYSETLNTLSGVDAKAAGSSFEFVPTATLNISTSCSSSNFFFITLAARFAMSVDC